MIGAGVGATTMAFVLLATVGGGTAAISSPALLSSGIAGYVGAGGYRSTLDPDAVASFVPGTSILRGRDDEAATLAPAAFSGTPARLDLPDAIAAQRAWLAAGRIPGRSPLEREVAARALLDLALLAGPDGAAVASPFGAWDLVWPRDSSWYVAAFAATGHPAEALSVLRFLARVQYADGTWEARYRPDGSPVHDGRARQLDAVGWVPWAVWSWWRASGDRSALRELWPTVTRAADAATAALGHDGLPRASADYTEQPESRPTLGTAGPLLLGLRSSADLAAALGEERDAQRWGTAARLLETAIAATFGRTGYQRHADGSAGPDSAVTFLSAALAPLPDESMVDAAVALDESRLRMPSGGLRPGDMPRLGGVSWTPTAALVALADSGDDVRFNSWFGWLAAHRTALGELPEKVTDDGRPASVAPLGWTDAIVLLALARRDGLVAAPPAPRSLTR